MADHGFAICHVPLRKPSPLVSPETVVCPKLCENFIKLCKVYYYNLNAFFNGS